MPVTSLHKIGAYSLIKYLFIYLFLKKDLICGMVLKKITYYKMTTTLTAATTASPTTPEGAFHVPRPTDGILAPLLRSKYKGPYLAFWSIFFYRNSQKKKKNHDKEQCQFKKKKKKKKKTEGWVTR
jgi:hypothetical protein